MAPPRKLSVTLSESLRNRLNSIAISSGVDLETYAATVLSAHTVGFASSTSRSGGRPVSIVPDDLPEGIERASNATGFAGVAKAGRLYTARVGRQLIGKFSSAELAATVRYFVRHAFVVGRGSTFAESGIPVEDALEMAARAGFSFEVKPVERDAVDPRQLCLVCKDTGKMPIRGVAGGTGRWWPCECPAGAKVDKPTDWDVSGHDVIKE